MQALRQARALASADGAPLFRFGQRFLAEGTYDVPAGHATSDLTSAACHIGLNRRRDLTLRGDLSLMVDGKQTKIVDLFKVRHAQFGPLAICHQLRIFKISVGIEGGGDLLRRHIGRAETAGVVAASS